MGNSKLLMAVASIFLFISLAFGEEAGPAVQEVGSPAPKINNLEMLLKSIDNVSKHISSTQMVLKGAGGLGREGQLRRKIGELIHKKGEMESTFIQLATGVAGQDQKTGDTHGIDWKKEVTDLLGPVIREIKRITANPRKIEKLRNQVDSLKQSSGSVNRARNNLKNLMSRNMSEALHEKLMVMDENLIARQEELKTGLDIASRELKRKQQNRKTISQSAREIMGIFFKSRGRNLIVSALALILVFVFMYYLHKPIKKYSPFHGEGRSVYTRFFDAIYFSFAMLASVFALLAVLYFFGDWVLLSLAVMFILGIAWASKQAVPYVWLQVKILLNLGPVREGEVVAYKGIPYLVKSLNFYTLFENNCLNGGSFRLPVKDLLELRSRPPAEDEPWFPSEVGNWVKLKDGTHGRVVVQTPETVRLELLGGSIVSYSTLEFLSLSPMNLASGFRLWITFGLDHEQRFMATKDIPTLIENEMLNDLNMLGYGDMLAKIEVIFKNAGKDSLDLEILADFNGKAGGDYEILQRVIPRVCVDICNRHQWIIPFQQIRLHLNSSGN